MRTRVVVCRSSLQVVNTVVASPWVQASFKCRGSITAEGTLVSNAISWGKGALGPGPSRQANELQVFGPLDGQSGVRETLGGPSTRWVNATRSVGSKMPRNNKSLWAQERTRQI